MNAFVRELDITLTCFPSNKANYCPSIPHRGTRSCAHSATPSPHPETWGVSTCKERTRSPPTCLFVLPIHSSAHLGFHRPPCRSSFVPPLSWPGSAAPDPPKSVRRRDSCLRDSAGFFQEVKTGWNRVTEQHWLSGWLPGHTRRKKKEKEITDLQSYWSTGLFSSASLYM